jgi:hypothetical protein
MPSGLDPMGGIRFSEKTMLKQKARAHWVRLALPVSLDV